MKKQIQIYDASVYVGTYKKYNEGSLQGQWMDLSDFTDINEFYNACQQLHADEKDPEYMFQDYENIPENLIGESWISENIFEIIQSLSALGEQQEAFLIWCNNGHHEISGQDIDELLSSYIGTYENDEDFARELIEEREDLSEFAKRYFDYEAYARDLFYGDYWSDGGYVFYNS